MMMMQLSESNIQKNSLFTAMNRFLGAVNNMDQTVMVPSLLRDVPLDEDREMGSMKSDDDEGDMFSYYQLLKSIRSEMEWGVRCSEAADRAEGAREAMKIKRTNSSMSTSSSASSTSSSSSSSSLSYDDDEDDEEEDEDLEKQFQFHLTGLHGVLSKLTQQANSLTKRYKQEVGIGGWGQ